MDGFSKRLAKAKVIGLDTSVIVYFLENNPQYAPLAQITIKGIEDGKWQGVTSTITLMEITVRPWQLGNETAAREYEAVLVYFPNLTIVDVDRNVARAAAQLQARYKVSPPDALQVAASIAYGANAFLTNDKRLLKLEDVIDVIVMDDFLEE
ncbi:MAG TPA: type II toxin-antitoxin system VapC family toxin [Anaerolineales bacterium]|nr:type II toxin-antitoxin system VapC family toxin [Anaerolineales bacterium]